MSTHRTTPSLISGTTDVYLIVGDPVEQVKAPELFNLVFAHCGIDAVLVPVQIAPAHLDDFVRSSLRASNIKGLWVAIPHKAPITGLLDSCTPAGRIAGAVNAIRREADGSLHGALFDGEGFARGLDFHGVDVAGRRVLILGAGGGASAIAVSLALAPNPPARIALFDPVPGKAAAVAGRIGSEGRAVGVMQVDVADSSDPAGWDVVINASPLGLNATDPLPFDVARLAPGAVLMDILMKNQPTPAVRAVRAKGHRAYPGFEMLIQQAPLYLEFFGFHEAAAHVRADAAFLREKLYPADLLAEVLPAN